MKNFELHEIGKLVRSLRKQRGLTQADLAEHVNIDVATLSKIENGHAMPRKNTLANLLQKLRFDAGDVTPLFLSEKEARFEKLKEKLPKIRDPRNPEHTQKMKEFIEEFEKDSELYEDEFNRQFVLTVQASILVNPANVAVTQTWGNSKLTKEESLKIKATTSFSPEIIADLDKAIEMYNQAMQLTIPVFEIEKLDEYYLSGFEYSIIRNLANAYYLRGKEDLSIDIYKQLEKGIDSNYRIKSNIGGSYLSIIANLCNLLINADRYEEALEYASKGFETCVELQLAMLPLLAQFKGIAMLEIVNKEKGGYDVPEAEEAKIILRDAYYGARLARRISVQQIVEALFATNFKTKVDGTPLEDI